MRRSSWVVLVLALLLVAGLVFVSVRPLDTTAPPMSKQVVEDVLNRAKDAVDRRDVSAMMALCTPDAKLLGQNPDQIRYAISRGFSDMGNEPVQVTWSNLTVEPIGNKGRASFTVDVVQRSKGVDANFFHVPLHVELSKLKAEHWFGLYTTEEWRVSEADSDTPVEGLLPLG